MGDLTILPRPDQGDEGHVPYDGLAPDAERASLRRAEQSLADALYQADVNNWRALSLLYAIYKSGAWKAATDDDGMAYTNFEVYLSDLRQRVPRMSVRWVQQNMKAITVMALLGQPLESLYSSTPGKVIQVARTVEVKGERIVGYRVEGGRDAVIRLLDDARDPETRFSELKKRVSGEMRVADTSFAVAETTDRALTITCFHDDLPYRATLALSEAWPREAVLALARRLGSPLE